MDFDIPQELLDALPDVCVFAKDVDGRLILANRALKLRFGREDVVGKSDQDFVPRSLADKYRADDLRIMSSGRPMRGLLELFLDARGIPSWHTADKWPLRSKRGRIIGVIGVSRHVRERGIAERSLRRVAERLRKRCAEPLRLGRLARSCRLSVRQFQRRFEERLWASPRDFLMRARAEKACVALRETADPLPQIALDCGFYDQSAFTRHFKARLGLTPAQYRRRFG
jgi:PAS domain S-box-containing protein